MEIELWGSGFFLGLTLISLGAHCYYTSMLYVACWESGSREGQML